MLKLVIVSGEMAGLEFPLDRDRVTLGRRPDNDVCVPTDMKMSRQHGLLTRQGEERVLEDQASANGTFLQQRRIYRPTPISIGDRFRMGRTWFEMAYEPDVSSDTQQAADEVVLVGEEPQAKDSPGAVGAPNIIFAVDAAHPEAEAPGDAQNRLEALLDFGHSLCSVLELSQLMRVAVDRIMNTVPAEQGSLLLLNQTTGEVEPKVVRRRVPRTGDSESTPQIRISKHIVTQALEQRLAILTTDATADARFLDADSVHDLRIRSAICAPMIAHGEPIGVIYLDTSSGTHVFSEHDVHLATGIAAQTAIALENARLYTDLRTAYDELRAAQEQLVRSQTIASVGVLAASIAHDMANIVSPLKPLINLLLSGEQVEGPAREILQRQTERLVTLVQRLLAFSRTADLERRPTEMNEVVDGTLSLVGTELAHRHIELVLSLAHDLPKVSADATQMERALLNLILNAADALDDAEEKRIEIISEVEDTDVLVSVKDTGPGIPEDVQQRLFEPFFTTKVTGTGLGLFSCRRIVEDEHEGSIEIDSREGAGTTITIRMPSLAAVANSAQAAPAAIN